MNILFVGLGSIARRHIFNLKEMLGAEAEITVLRHGNSNAAERKPENLLIHTCYKEAELDSWYDAVFITNPTSLHYETLRKCNSLSGNFFIEKPVFMTGEEDLSVFSNNRKIYYVACPLRYCNVIQYLKKHMDFSAVYSIRVISSSFLPAWRPGMDYRATYSAHSQMGGGVSIDLIHEWDYINFLIGFPKCVKSMIHKKSNLEIDADDIAVYIAEYADKIVEIHLDYFGRKAIRRIELFARDDTIVADLLTQKISWLKAGKKIDLAQDRNDYQKRELLHFFDITEGKCVCDNSLEDSCRILKIARGAE